MSRRRVFIIGIDGASFDVLGPHVRAGRMPHLRTFLESGIHADLTSVCPPISPAAWTSFHTGKEPAKHGIWGFQGFDSRAGTAHFNTSQHIHGRTFWQILSESGFRVGVVNVPMTFPPPKLNGVVVSGFETPSTRAAFCHPPELKSRVLKAIPDYLLGPDPEADDRTEIVSYLLDAGVRELGQRATLVELLHGDERFDVFMVNFQSLDWSQHNLYVYLVEEFGSAIRKDLLAGSRNLIRTLDESIGSVLVVARDYDVQLVVSDHGFTRERGAIYANVALDEWGYRVPRSPTHESVRQNLPKRIHRRMLHSDWRLLRSVAWAVRGWRRPARQRWVVSIQRSDAGTLQFDPLLTRASVVPSSEPYGLVYLNRHPSGPLAGASAAVLRAERDDLARRFRAIKNPVTATNFFDQVLFPPQMDHNARRGDSPDLILVPAPGLRVRAGRAREEAVSPMVLFAGFADTLGIHAMNGVFAASGKGVPATGRIDALRLVDIAPTILALAGLPIPTEMDGETIAALRTEPVAVIDGPCEITEEEATQTASMTKEDERLLEERLRSLGYLE